MVAFIPFTLPIPRDLSEWEERREQYRRLFYQLLGDLPPLFTPELTLINSQERDGYRLDKFTFANGLDDLVYGYTLVPYRPNGAAVLYCHYHGGNYHLGKDELFNDNTRHTSRGVSLARAGYVVLAIDAYAFGERQHQGAAGLREHGYDTERALFKQFLWEGSSLWGMIIHDDLLALNLLLHRPDIDPARVAVTGASMGGSRATWLAALDDRIKLVAPVIQYTRYQDLIATGDLNRHSIYYYVPGVLKAGLDMEALVALAAPRPQIVLVGGADPLSPPNGIPIINDFARAVYRLYGAEDYFEPHVYPDLAHVYTADMFASLSYFLKKYL